MRVGAGRRTRLAISTVVMICVLALAKLGLQVVPAMSESLRQIALEGTHDGFGTGGLSLWIGVPMSAREGQVRVAGDGDEVALARQAARAFCRRFDFPAEKIAELNGEPLFKSSLERDGHRVTAMRWLGSGRGDYVVQVELYTDSKRIVVYGGYAHRMFDPLVYRKDDGSMSESNPATRPNERSHRTRRT